MYKKITFPLEVPVRKKHDSEMFLKRYDCNVKRFEKRLKSITDNVTENDKCLKH